MRPPKVGVPTARTAVPIPPRSRPGVEPTGRVPVEPGAIGAPSPAGPRGDRAALRKLSNQLEGVFMNQLFQAMRAAVPKAGLLDASPGEELFTSLLDERLAGQAAERMHRGIGEALYRQLARRLPPEESAANAAPAISKMPVIIERSGESPDPEAAPAAKKGEPK